MGAFASVHSGERVSSQPLAYWNTEHMLYVDDISRSAIRRVRVEVVRVHERQDIGQRRAAGEAIS